MLSYQELVSAGVAAINSEEHVAIYQEARNLLPESVTVISRWYGHWLKQNWRRMLSQRWEELFVH